MTQMLELLLRSHTFLKLCLFFPHILFFFHCCFDWLLSIVLSNLLILSFVPLTLQLNLFSGYILVFKFLKFVFKSCSFCSSFLVETVSFVSNVFMNCWLYNFESFLCWRLYIYLILAGICWCLFSFSLRSPGSWYDEWFQLKPEHSGSYVIRLWTLFESCDVAGYLRLPWWTTDMPPHYWGCRWKSSFSTWGQEEGSLGWWGGAYYHRDEVKITTLH